MIKPESIDQEQGGGEPSSVDPSVIIGIPVFNEELLIERSVRSALDQDHSGVRVVVSDNCSTDGTREILARLIDESPKLTVFFQDVNLGLIGNLEFIRQASDSRYFMWLGADDHIEPRFVSSLISVMETKGETIGLAMTGLSLESSTTLETAEFLFVRPNHPNFMSRTQIVKRMISASPRVKSLKFNYLALGVYRKKILDQILDNDPTIYYGGDRVLPALVAMSKRIMFVEEVLFVKRIQSASFGKRHPRDKRTVARKELSSWRTFIRVNMWVFRCPVIPIYRKPLILFATVPQLRRRLFVELVERLNCLVRST